MEHLPKKIELLAPARDYETALEAISHGADAVYIGAPRFSARKAAANSLADIEQLVQHAHKLGVKIYVALNTIIYEEELADAEKLIHELYSAGVDALIVQDKGITRLNIPPIALHASTQMDNCSIEKAEFLYNAGFKQIVLARELSLDEISSIHRAVPEARLEAFVHGALCVSYSGRCYASHHCFGRSANRGECAQFCRLPFDLVDADGEVIVKDKHLLSLKDMNRSDDLERMLDAGVVSLKIEGRLKEKDYVKNVTAYYRQKLDAIFARRSEYVRASNGTAPSPQFEPALEKSFNRGFTKYFLYGRGEDITSFDTPKSIGERMGVVKKVFKNYILVSDGSSFANGDGACFIDSDGKLQGFRINRVEGDRLFPQTMPAIAAGCRLYRNLNIAFERQVKDSRVSRKLPLDISFNVTESGFSLTATDECGISATVAVEQEKSIARTPQRENLLAQLSKWGNTIFEVRSISVLFDEEYFIRSSVVADMRRTACQMLEEKLISEYSREEWQQPVQEVAFIKRSLDYTANVANSKAREYYTSCGVESIDDAFEIGNPSGVPIMYCKHCLRYSMGWCSKDGKRIPHKEPLYLELADGRRFRLNFDCRNCTMQVLASDDK